MLAGGASSGRPLLRFLCLSPYELWARLRRWLARCSSATANDTPFWAARTVEDLPRRSSKRRHV
jgi:hypothetical protein